MIFKYKFQLPDKDCYSTNLNDIAKLFNISLRTLKYKMKEGLEIETINITLEQIHSEYTLLPQGILVVLHDKEATNKISIDSLAEKEATNKTSTDSLPDRSAKDVDIPF